MKQNSPNILTRILSAFALPPAVSRFNRTELWFCLAAAAFYAASVLFVSFGQRPTQLSMVYADLQSITRAISVVLAAWCLSLLCTKHSVVEEEQNNLEKSAQYAVRCLFTFAVVLAIK